MDRSLLDSLCCPACGGNTWTLEAAETATIPYAAGPRDEVRSGELHCACGQVYPIREYVLSLAGRFPPDLAREAAFWNRFYLWNIEHGAVGFHDLKRGFAPYLAQGVTEAFPAADTIDRYDIHYQVAEHPLLRAGHTLLDIGVGLGWTSLHFARAGYAVTAFDPSLGPMQAAKAYAIEQGLFIEYLCAAVGYVNFKEGAFDNVAGFHSLHHVPDLEAGMADIRRWLRPGGGLAVDEHVGNSPLAAALGREMHAWAVESVLPAYRTIPDADLAALPQEGHSAMEDAGAAQVVPLLRRDFDIQYEHTRHVVLDHYPLLYYLAHGKDLTAYQHSLAVATQIQTWLAAADPAGGEYVTIVAANRLPVAGDEGSGVGGRGSDDRLRKPEGFPLWVADCGLRNDGDGELAEEETTQHATRNTQHAEAEEENPQSAIRNPQSAERIAELEAALAAQGAWARSLEAAVQARERELRQMRQHLRRVENGRVMRLLRLISRESRR